MMTLQDIVMIGTQDVLDHLLVLFPAKTEITTPLIALDFAEKGLPESEVMSACSRLSYSIASCPVTRYLWCMFEKWPTGTKSHTRLKSQ